MYLTAELGAPVLLGSAFVLAARLAEGLGLAATAIRLHGAADMLYEDAGFELLPGDQALSDAMRSRVVAQLGPERVDALTREEALDPARHRPGRGGGRATAVSGLVGVVHRPQPADALGGGRVGRKEVGHAGLLGVAAALQLGQRVVDQA